MSGGLLLRIKLPTTPTGAHVPLESRTVGFTTRSADWTGDIMGSGESLLYRRGYLTGDITSGNRLDISGGRGGFAEAIEGQFSLVDSCPGGTISAALQSGDVLLRGAMAWLASISSSGAIKRQWQLMVADMEVTDQGTIKVKLKSPSYMSAKAMSKLVNLLPWVQSPSDPLNFSQTAAQGSSNSSAGYAFGNRPVSVKEGNAPDVVRLIWRGYTQVGDGLSGSYQPTTFSSFLQDTISTYIPAVATPASPGKLKISTRDAYEVSRFSALINTINASANAQVVFSDGSWFAGPNSYTINTSDPTQSGLGNFFVILSADAYPNFSDNANCNVGAYIVPKNIIALAGIGNILGAAISQNSTKITVPIPGDTLFSAGVLNLAPYAASSEGYFASQSLFFTPGWLLGTIVPSPGSNTGTTMSGSLSAINTDPSAQAASDPFSLNANLTGSTQFPVFGLEVQHCLSLSDMKADYYSIDYSMKIWANSLAVFAANLACYGPGDPIPWDTRNGYDLAAVYYNGVTANKKPKHPKWSTVAGDIKSLSTAMHNNIPKLVTAPISGWPPTARLELHIQELFIWAHSKLSFSNSYLAILPGFAAPEDLSRCVATGGGAWLISGAANQYRSTDAVNWIQSSIPAAGGNGLLGLAYGVPGWVGFGALTSGGFASFLSTDGGVTWAGTARPFLGSACIWTGSQFVAVGGTLVGNADGPAATYTSPDGVSWTARTNPTTQANLYGVAIGTNVLVAVGASDPSPYPALILRSTDGGYNWTAQTSATTQSLRAIVSNGVLFCAAGASGAIQTSPDGITWTLRTSGTTNSLSGLAISGSVVIAVGAAGTILKSVDYGVTWKVIASCISTDLARIATDGAAWVVAGSGGVVWTSLDAGETWVPSRAKTPQDALASLRGTFFGGESWNPMTWSGFAGPSADGAFGISFDPPDPSAGEDFTASDSAAAKICEEWWGFAGETIGAVDASTDSLEIALPNVFPGALEDVATILTIQFAPWAGSYLKSAYVQNVDVPYDSSKGDSFYFAGWDASGNTNGLAIWNACRNSYLSSGILRPRTITLDSVHDEATLGSLFLAQDPDLGRRIDWICGRPRYVRLTAQGQDAASAPVYSGCRYTMNQTLIQARGLTLPSRGVVVDAQHNHTKGRHEITVGLLASGVNFPILFLATVGAILQVWCLVSGGAGWSGCAVMQSWDGVNYTQVGTITTNNPTGYLSEDMARLLASPGRRAHPRMVAGGSDILTADWTESSVEPPVPAWSDFLADSPGALLWVDGEILGHAYQADQGHLTTQSNTLRRGLYGTQPRPHVKGARVGAMTQTSFRWNVPGGHSGQTCYFRFPNLSGDFGLTGTYSVVIA